MEMKLEPGQKIAFKASRQNAGALTINGKVVTRPDGTPLSVGYLKVGQEIEVDIETGDVTTLTP